MKLIVKIEEIGIEVRKELRELADIQKQTEKSLRLFIARKVDLP